MSRGIAGSRLIEEGGAAMSLPPVFLEVQMNTNIKRRFAIIVTVTALVGAAALGLWLFSVHDRAANIDPSPISGGTGRDGEDDGFPVVDWDYWLSVNPDIVAWVSVPGTEIDYPVVQASADDPTFYLDHDVYHGWNPYGCPYLDAGCAERGIDSPLALMFAHHMNDGSMFLGVRKLFRCRIRRRARRDPPADARRKHAPARRRGRRRRLERRAQAARLRHR